MVITMKIKVNTIITLDDNNQYVVLNETMYQANKYFLVMGIKDKEVNSSDVAILKEEVEGLDTYVIKVEEPELIATLTKMLKAQI